MSTEPSRHLDNGSFAVPNSPSASGTAKTPVLQWYAERRNILHQASVIPCLHDGLLLE